MNRRGFLRGAAAAPVAALATGSALAASTSAAPAPRLSNGTNAERQLFPNFEVVGHDGKTYRFYDDLIKGQTVILSFFYMACTDGLCPTQTKNLVDVHKLLKEKGMEQVRIYSITLRPETDTPKVLAEYAEGFGIQPGFLLLRAKPEQTEAMRRWLGYVEQDLDKDADAGSHTGMLRYGNDAISRWSGCPAALNPAQIVKSVQLVSGMPTTDRLPWLQKTGA